MPNLPSAKKAFKQSKQRATLNRRYKNRIKVVGRELQSAVEAQNPEEIKTKLSSFFKAIDKAAKKNILHRNTANRKKALASKRAHIETTAKKTSSQEK